MYSCTSFYTKSLKLYNFNNIYCGYLLPWYPNQLSLDTQIIFKQIWVDEEVLRIIIYVLLLVIY